MSTSTLTPSAPPSSRRPSPEATSARSSSAEASPQAAAPPRVRALEQSGERRPHASWSERAKNIGTLLKETYTQWSDDEAARLAASLSLYTLLSIAPLLVIAVAVAGLAFGDEAARGHISQELATVVGPQAGESIQGMIANAKTPSSGIISSVIGIVVVLFGASGVFGELQSALNRIWEVKPKPGRGIKGLLRDRFLSFSMVMGVAFLLLVSLVVSAALASISGFFKGMISFPFLWEAVNVIVSLAGTSVLFALIFKLVPDVKVAWRDVWVGGFVTALLFSIGRVALGWYVGRSATVSPFGAAGSLVALVVWVYYSAQILFMGAEFAQVYASRYGSRIVPSKNAVPLNDDESAAAQRERKEATLKKAAAEG
jgi:membrane protein